MTTNPKARKAAVAWINGPGRDFHAGINILVQAGFKPGVVARLGKVGPQGPEAHQRLNFLIREFVSVFGSSEPEDTDPELHVFNGKESPQDTPQAQSRAILAVADRMEADQAATPPNIAKVIREYASLYKQRGQACRQLADVPAQNTDDFNSQRKQLSDQIEQITDRLEQLYPLYEQYLATGDDIPETVETRIGASSDQSDPNESSHQSEDNPYSDMDITALKKLRHNLAAKRSRASNYLRYQQETALPKPNPMPDSPAKLKYTRKIQKLNEEIQAIDYAIASRT